MEGRKENSHSQRGEVISVDEIRGTTVIFHSDLLLKKHPVTCLATNPAVEVNARCNFQTLRGTHYRTGGIFSESTMVLNASAITSIIVQAKAMFVE